MFDERFRIVGATVLVIEVVGMLPDVDSQHRDLAMGDRRICVVGGSDGELAAVQYKPGPAAAELPHGGSREFLGEGVIATQIAFDARRDLAIRSATAVRVQRAPIECVIPSL